MSCVRTLLRVMEIVIDDSLKPYNFTLDNGELIPFNRAILEYFGTTSTMVADMGSTEMDPSLIALPLAPFITKPVIQWCISTCMAHRRNILHKRKYDGTLQFLFDVFVAADFLEAKFIMADAVDNMYRLLRKMATDDIRSYVDEAKAVKEVDTNSLPKMPYYIREKLIYDCICQNLPNKGVSAVHAIHPAIQKHINPVAVSYTHTLFLNSVGLHGIGSNKYGELGINRDKDLHPIDPNQISIPEKPLFAVCGENISFCATIGGGLYACGTNHHEHMGLGSQDFAYTSNWHKLDLTGEVLLVAVGSMHTLILTTKGLYATGKNKFGQLGTGDTQQRNYLQKVDVNGVVIAIACGTNHSVVLTSTGLYGCGCGGNGELPGVTDEITMRLTKLSGFVGDIVSIACADRCTEILTTMALYRSLHLDRDEHGKPTGLLLPHPLPNSEAIPLSVMVIPGRVFVLDTKGLLYSNVSSKALTLLTTESDQKDFVIHSMASSKRMMYAVVNDWIYKLFGPEIMNYASPSPENMKTNRSYVMGLGWGKLSQK